MTHSSETIASIQNEEDTQTSSTNCPDELYNLTKLAEVAVATGKIEQKKCLVFNLSKNTETYTHKLFDMTSRTQHCQSDMFEENKGCQQSVSSQSHVLSSNRGDHLDCIECGKQYSTISNLARHKQTHRSPADKKARRCPHCGKIYVSMPAFSMHVRTHNQGCKCQYCGKCFSRPWLLQGHIRTHTGEKPFKCNICSKAFADKSNLRAHIQTHSNKKPHICGRCGKAFALKSYLYKHEESSCIRINTRQLKAKVVTDTYNKLSSPAISPLNPILPINVSDIFSDEISTLSSPTIINSLNKVLLKKKYSYEIQAPRNDDFQLNRKMKEQPMNFSSKSEKQISKQSLHSTINLTWNCFSNYRIVSL